MDQSGEDTTHGLNTEGKWGNIKKKDVLYITSKNCTLDGSTNSDGFIWVYTLVWSFSEEFFDTVLYLWHSSHTTDAKNLINLFLGET